ncbi:MAG TPA: LAGLIDADG family homing endonuclease, partial [Actinomycetota bacterium]|nr:LAGLIDADG family homing endonuclease [Actinomycetota bacterium]
MAQTPAPDPLGIPLAKAPGVSPALAKALEEGFGYRTARDLIEHYPRRYLTRGELTDLAHAKKGAEVTLVGTVRNLAKKMPRRNLRILEVRVADDSGAWVCTWFNQPWHAQKLTVGTVAAFSGKLAWKAGRLGMANPGYEVLREGDDPEGFANEVIPVYPATKEISSGRLRRAVGALLDRYGDVPDFVPEPLRRAHGLPDRAAALEAIHRPADRKEATRARDRLVYDELFVLQVGLALRRRAQEAGQHGQALQIDGDLTKRLLSSLPFQPTAAQSRVMSEIGADLSRSKPMHRLLQGEVGSGKAQPIESLVLTPGGFKRMGEIEVGDEVVNPTGEITVVTGVFPQGHRDVWRVVFSDGSTVECDDEHLWAVNTSAAWYRGQTLKVKTTREIREDLLEKNGSSKWYIPGSIAVDLECGEERPLDPYLLGLLLGDGTFRANLAISTADQEIVDAASAALPPGCFLKQTSSRKYDYLIQCKPRPNQFQRHPVAVALQQLGLRGLLSRDKHVPRAYLVAPIKVRHAILQGLLDTDGTVNRKQGSNVSFLSASRRLADDVRSLVHSLGGLARVRPVTKSGETYFHVSLRLPNEFPPFRLDRKAHLCRPLTRYHSFRRGIRRV